MNKIIQVAVLLASISMSTRSDLVAQQLSPTTQQQLATAKPGSVLEIPDFLSENFPRISDQKIILPGPQFIISDDPEYIRVPEAVALREQVKPGLVRLYVYNVNGVKEPKRDRKITALIKNRGKKDLHVTLLKVASQAPSTNYFKLGKEGLFTYFSSNTTEKAIVVKPGRAVPIDPALERQVVKYDELVHGIYEFMVDQPAEISILQTAPDADSEKVNARIEEAIPTNHKNAGRGLFGVSNYLVRAIDTLSTAAGTKQWVVADGKSDPWITGIEGQSGAVSTLAGNYGVMYEMELDWVSPDGKGLALLTWNARADNQWCSAMATSMVVSDGVHPGGVVQLPADRLNTKGSPEAVVVQVFKPDPNKKVQRIKLTYSPPGASCLPTPFVFVPITL